MDCLSNIQSVGSIATAIAVVWSFFQYRLDNKKFKEQMEIERKRFFQERLEYMDEKTEEKIEKLNRKYDKYAEIILITEKLKWTLKSLRHEVSKVDSIDIKNYEPYFSKLSEILNQLEPWQQAIIGDLPIDPLINKYYVYYNYKTSDDLLSWIEHFENQIDNAKDNSSEMMDNFMKTIEELHENQMKR